MTVLSLLPFPPLLWWREVLQSPDSTLDLEEPFRKMGYRNRYRLASSNGPLWLTIPILGGREQRTPVGEIQIDNKLPWQRSHWRSITSIYRRTPFFEHYEPSLQALFITPYAALADFNLASVNWCRDALRLAVNFKEKTCFPENAALKDRRERWLSFTRFPEKSYSQPFLERTGFLRGMSVLDALFCEGPATASFLQ